MADCHATALRSRMAECGMTSDHQGAVDHRQNGGVGFTDMNLDLTRPASRSYGRSTRTGGDESVLARRMN
jgi:hypothetical protein